MGEPDSCSIEQNYVSDVVGGIGIIIDASSVHMYVNQVKKCEGGGMLVQSSQTYQTDDELDYLDNFALIQIDQQTLHYNKNFGMQILDFYGLIQVKKSNVHDNEGYGFHVNAQNRQNDMRPFLNICQTIFINKSSISQNTGDGVFN